MGTFSLWGMGVGGGGRVFYCYGELSRWDDRFSFNWAESQCRWPVVLPPVIKGVILKVRL